MFFALEWCFFTFESKIDVMATFLRFSIKNQFFSKNGSNRDKNAVSYHFRPHRPKNDPKGHSGPFLGPETAPGGSGTPPGGPKRGPKPRLKAKNRVFCPQTPQKGVPDPHSTPPRQAIFPRCVGNAGIGLRVELGGVKIQRGKSLPFSD